MHEYLLGSKPDGAQCTTFHTDVEQAADACPCVAMVLHDRNPPPTAAGIQAALEKNLKDLVVTCGVCKIVWSPSPDTAIPSDPNGFLTCPTCATAIEREQQQAKRAADWASFPAVDRPQGGSTSSGATYSEAINVRGTDPWLTSTLDAAQANPTASTSLGADRTGGDDWGGWDSASPGAPSNTTGLAATVYTPKHTYPLHVIKPADLLADVEAKIEAISSKYQVSKQQVAYHKDATERFASATDSTKVVNAFRTSFK